MSLSKMPNETFAHSTGAAVCVFTGQVQSTKSNQTVMVHGSTYKCKGACAVQFNIPGVWDDVKDDVKERAKHLTAISQKIRRECKCKSVTAQSAPSQEKRPAEQSAELPADPQAVKKQKQTVKKQEEEDDSDEEWEAFLASESCTFLDPAGIAEWTERDVTDWIFHHRKLPAEIESIQIKKEKGRVPFAHIKFRNTHGSSVELRIPLGAFVCHSEEGPNDFQDNLLLQHALTEGVTDATIACMVEPLVARCVANVLRNARENDKSKLFRKVEEMLQSRPGAVIAAIDRLYAQEFQIPTSIPEIKKFGRGQKAMFGR